MRSMNLGLKRFKELIKGQKGQHCYLMLYFSFIYSSWIVSFYVSKNTTLLYVSLLMNIVLLDWYDVDNSWWINSRGQPTLQMYFFMFWYLIILSLQYHVFQITLFCKWNFFITFQLMCFLFLILSAWFYELCSDSQLFLSL